MIDPCLKKSLYFNAYTEKIKMNNTTFTKPTDEKEVVFYDRIEKYDIMKTIRDIQLKRTGMGIDEISNLHPIFKKENPELFTKVVKTSMSDSDISNLVYMTETRERVKRGEISFSDASREVSIHFAKQYQPEMIEEVPDLIP
jgi:hypothetical protein